VLRSIANGSSGPGIAVDMHSPTNARSTALQLQATHAKSNIRARGLRHLRHAYAL
jgi:hypothetical protein